MSQGNEPEAPKRPNSVKYTGRSNTRIITAEQFALAGVENQDGVVWDKDNKFLVKASKLNDSAIELLETLKDFRINR